MDNMLRVTVEIIPWGHEELTTELGRIEIVNDGSGSIEIGNYDITFYDKNNVVMKNVRVVGHRRLDGFWSLVRKTLSKK